MVRVITDNMEGQLGFSHGKIDLARIGLFSDPKYISSGEAFNSKKGVSSLDYRCNGKQFLTAPLHKGHDTKDSYFDQHYTRLFEGEKYVDLVKMRRGWRMLAKEKNITKTPFKPSSVPKRPSGKGSQWGTIEQQFPLKDGGKFTIPLKAVPEERKKPELKNFLTAPSKKGSGYGYKDVTIGKYYAYESDPYGAAIIVERTERLEGKKKMVDNKAFVSASTNHEYFNEFARITKPEAPAGVKGAVEVGAGGAAGEEKKKETLLPFKPSSAFSYTINPYPSYEPPKVPLKLPPAPGKNLIFRPSGVTGSFPVRSIIESNTPIAPPVWLRKAIHELNINND